MLSSTRLRILALTSLVAFAGCNSSAPGSASSNAVSAAAQNSTADLSGPPVINPKFAAREPRKCTKVMSAPTPAQAVALVQCTDEELTSTEDVLTQNITLEMGSGRPYTQNDSINVNSIDPTAKVYDLRGSSDAYRCQALDWNYKTGANCYKYPAAPGNKGQGKCWKTTFGEWACSMTSGGTEQLLRQPGPTTY